MANAIILGWNRAVAGREKHAMELFQSSVAYWTKKQQAGVIESFEPVIFTAHGGDLNGFFYIKGEPAKLDALQHEKEYVELVMQIALALEGFGVIRAYQGERLQELMQSWGSLIQKY